MNRQELSLTYGVTPEWVDEKVKALVTQYKCDEDTAIELIACARDKYGHAMPRFLRVRDKQNNLVPMYPTPIHLKFVKHRKRIAYCVKPRQIWFTTFCEGDYYLDCISGTGKKVLFINLDNRVTEEIFDRVKTANREFTLPAMLPKETRNTTRKLSWENGSAYDAITAKNDDGPDTAKQLGRSCTVQRIHVTEAAYMRYYREFVNGLLDSKPTDALVVFESTGNGAQGGFYEDCTEIFDKGVLVAPNTWVLGDKSLHFFGWWEHPEYRMEEDPLEQFRSQMDFLHIQKLEQSEQEHLKEMRKDAGLHYEDVQRAINWRRWRLFNEKGFLRDPDGALLNMDREYPAKMRHAFSSTGSAFLSLSKTDARSQEWKANNIESGKPFRGNLMKGPDGKYQAIPGTDVMFWEMPSDEPWKNRYCIGSDVGGGSDSSDPDCIYVKDRLTGRYVAVSHGRHGPIKNAEIMMALGYYYQTAKLCPELNNHGIGVAIKLYDDRYPNLYRHNKDASEWRGIGYLEGATTRKAALQLLKLAYESNTEPWVMPYEGFYKEAAAFAPPAGKPDGKIEGQGGTADDCVMAAAVTEACSDSMPTPEKIEYAPPSQNAGFAFKMGF